MKFARVSCARSSVYLAKMNNGLVKIGFSDNPRTRFSSLRGQVRRKYGSVIAEFHVYEGVGVTCSVPGAWPTASGRARAVESRCIGILSKLGKACTPSVEFFWGVDFTEAKRLIDAEIASLAIAKEAA